METLTPQGLWDQGCRWWLGAWPVVPHPVLPLACLWFLLLLSLFFSASTGPKVTSYRKF